MKRAAQEIPIVFRCRGSELLGIQHVPGPTNSKERDLAVIIVVGGPQYRVGSHRQFVLTARYLAVRGFPVFRFDHRGMGDSEGVQRTFEDLTDDIDAAAEVVLEHTGVQKIVFVGLCDAASAILMYRAVRERCAGLVLLNPWVRTPTSEAKSLARHYYWQRLTQRSFWLKLGSGRWNAWRSMCEFADVISKLRARPVEVAETYIDRMREGLHAACEPVFFCLSGQDLSAHEFDALILDDQRWRRLIDRPSVEVVHFPDADHTFSQRKSLDELNECIVSWMNRIAR